MSKWRKIKGGLKTSFLSVEKRSDRGFAPRTVTRAWAMTDLGMKSKGSLLPLSL